MNYRHLTTKQANTVYKAVKQGKLDASKMFINSMYSLVGRTDLASDEFKFYHQIEVIVKYLLEGNYKFAQAIIDGKRIVSTPVIWNVKMLSQDDVDNEYWFDSVGDVKTEVFYYDSIEEDK